MIVREMNRESLELVKVERSAPPTKEQTNIVQEALRETLKLNAVEHIEKVIYQSMVRSITEVYQLAESCIFSGEPLPSVWEVCMESLIIGYGNIRNGNLHPKLVNMLSYVYRFRMKYAVFELFALLNGLLTDLPYNHIIAIVDFELCMKLISGLNCSSHGGTLVADTLFTTKDKIQACCASILRGFLGRSLTDEVMGRLYRLII